MLTARRRALLTGLAAAPMVAAASTRARSQARGEVGVYSSRHYDTDRDLYEGFTRETGIRVRLIEGGADQLMERMRNEGANSPADVLITVDAARLWRSKDAGLLQPVRSQTLESRIPANLRDPEGFWFGLTMRARVIMYDKALGLPAGLATYEDLARTDFRNMLCVRSSANEYNVSLAGSILAAHGPSKLEEWAKGVVANMARPPQGGDTPQILAVAAGQCRLAISNTYYLGRLINSSKPDEKAVGERIGVLFPNQGDRGTHVNVSGAGVARHAPNRAAAIAFIEYLTSDRAQKIFAEGNFEYPVVAGVPLHPTLTAFGPFKQDSLNAATFGANGPEALQIMQRAGWR
jgi:iron(III) transport system substrate-binding protein